MSPLSLEVAREDLLAGLGAALRFIPSKSAVPILSNVLLQATPGEVRLTGTDLSVAATLRMTASVSEPWSITLPAQLLNDYLTAMDGNGSVTITLADGGRSKVHFEYARFKANIAGLPAEDFPPRVDAKPESSFSLPSATFRALIDHVVFSAAREDSRPVLAGVLLLVEGTALTMAAADGYRLAVETIDLPEPGPSLSVIIPAKFLEHIGALLSDSRNDLVTIGVLYTDRHDGKAGSRVHVAFGGTELISQLIDGQFPDYQRIIPTSYKTDVTMPTSAILRATRAAAVFARDNSMIVRLEYDSTTPEQILVRSSSADLGDNETRVEAATVVGESNLAAFNGRYLREAMAATTSPNVRVGLTGRGSPAVIRPDDSGTLIMVVMPMSITPK